MDQFFGFNLPMDITHLQGLLSVVFHTLDAYLLKLLDELGITHLCILVYLMDSFITLYASLTFTWKKSILT